MVSVLAQKNVCESNFYKKCKNKNDEKVNLEKVRLKGERDSLYPSKGHFLVGGPELVFLLLLTSPNKSVQLHSNLCNSLD